MILNCSWLPTYAHSGAAGDVAADLYSIEEKELFPGTIDQVRTGIAIELPRGYGALVEDRSGLATRGITTLGGVVDNGYRGEIRVIIAHLGKDSIWIKSGDRIAQLRLIRKFDATFVVSDSLTDSTRSDKGYGSTGS